MQVYKLQILAILAVAHCAFALEHVYSYVNEDYKFPKCCKHGSHLILDNSTLLCREGHYLKSQIGFKYNSDGNYCIDLLFEEYSLIKVDRRTILYNTLKNVIKYPKCCPLGFGYDNKEHKCVLDANRAKVDEIDGLIIEVGLSKCKSTTQAIIDYSSTGSSLIIDPNLSIQLANGKKINYGNYCFDINIHTGDKIVRICQNYESVCQTSPEDDGIPCYKKCCADGESYIRRNCTPTFDTGISLNDPRLEGINGSNNYGIISAKYCKKYIVTPAQELSISRVGVLNIKVDGHWKSYNSRDAPYCIETVDRIVQYIFLCFEDSSYTFQLPLKPIFMCLSIIFTSITLIVFTILPEMRSLYGNSLMAFFTTLIIGYGCILYGLYKNNNPFCVEIGFIISFFMIAFFTWLNVISFDMWASLGQMRLISTNKKREARRFLYYNMYAWGVPTFCTAATFIVYKTECLPDNLRPDIGKTICFFESSGKRYGKTIFFLTPVTILIVINCIFFIKTIIYCSNVKNEINRMANGDREKSKRSKKLNIQKEKLVIFMKLALIMGVLWLFETVSTFKNFRKDPILAYIEYVWDCFNALMGVFIFAIFILKKNILESLRNKLYGRIRRVQNEKTTLSTTSSKVVTGSV